jgi:hypothetical protein
MEDGQTISAVMCRETRGDNRPSDHDTLLGLDDGRGVKAG